MWWTCGNPDVFWWFCHVVFNFFVFIDTSQIPKRPFFMTYWHILTLWLSRSLLARCISPMFFCEPTGCNDKTSKKSFQWLGHQMVWSLLKRGAKGGGLTASFCGSSCNLASKPPFFVIQKKKCGTLCFQGGVLENFGFRDGKPQEGTKSEEIQQCNQCLRVFESGSQPVRMQFRYV